MQSGVPIVNVPDFSQNAKSPWASALQGALQGYSSAQQMQAQNYANQIKAAQAKYALPMAEAANTEAQVKAQYAQPLAAQSLKTAQLQNIWNPKIWQSEIGLRGAQGQQATAQAGLAQSQQALNTLYNKYPILLHPEAYAYAQYLSNKGTNPQGMPTSGQGKMNSTGNNLNNGNNTTSPPSAIAPYTTTQAQQQQATQNVTEYNNEQKTAAQDSQSILQMIRDLDQGHQGYLDSSAKGSAIGDLPSHGITTMFGDWSPERQADTNFAAFVKDSGHEMGSKLTNAILQQIKASKISRNMDPNAEINTYHFIRANLVRALQANDFTTAARGNNVPWNDAVTAFKQYNEDNPAYDTNNQIANPIANYNAYLTPQAIQALDQGKRINPKAEGNLATPPSERSSKVTKRFKRVNGKLTPA